MPSKAVVQSVSEIVVLAISNENSLMMAGIKTMSKVSDPTKQKFISKHPKPSFRVTNRPMYHLNNQLTPIVAVSMVAFIASRDPVMLT
jgi:hypothetical protein